MDNKQKEQALICPECDSAISFPDEIITGKIIECSVCGAESEIINLKPLQLAPLEEEK